MSATVKPDQVETLDETLELKLPTSVLEGLEHQANRTGSSTTELARLAIETWLEARERTEVADELRAYAERMAGTEADLDPDLEAAGIENWLENVP